MTLYYAKLKSKHNNKVILTSPLYTSSKYAEAWIKRKTMMYEKVNVCSEIIVLVEE